MAEAVGWRRHFPWLVPHSHCLLCGAGVAGRRPICPGCEGDLPRLGPACQTCALPLPLAGQTCPSCLGQPPAFHRVVAPWRYDYPLDRLIIRFKHHRHWPLGKLLGSLLAEALQQAFAQGLPRPELLIPVPLSRKGLRQRGFNQAQMLAEQLAAILQLPQHQAILRVQETSPQQQLNAKARRRNLRTAFALAPNADIRERHLALVDDVLTTGSTADALARVLVRAGARRVDVYCLARTPAPNVAIANQAHKPTTTA